jgi:hypothetical protein
MSKHQNRSKNASPRNCLSKRTQKILSELTKKLRLLKMAINGGSRPVYDPEFDREIMSLRPHWFDREPKPSKKTVELIPSNAPKGKTSLESVIRRVIDSEKSNNPALKAHATRALRAYSFSRAEEIGSTPTRVIAGVRAAVTKRKMKGM